MSELASLMKHMVCLFLTTSYVLLRIRQTISAVEEQAEAEAGASQWDGEISSTFSHDYLVDFLLPVSALCLTLLSIMVGLQQVINICIDLDDEDHPFQQQQTKTD